jgi:hypothetical protein
MHVHPRGVILGGNFGDEMSAEVRAFIGRED